MKLYVVCATCGEIVRLNKPFIGSIHFCRSDEYTAETSQYLRDKYFYNKRLLERQIRS